MIAATAGVAFPLRVFQNGCVDVCPVFNVRVEYVAEGDVALLAVVEPPLGERVVEVGEEEEIAMVLGRACGDRVAVVSCSPGVTDLEFFGTLAHERRHTVGLDHITQWRCLENPSC